MAAVPTSSLSDNQRQELLCTYASLILSDEGMEISAENIKKLVTAAGGSVEPYMPGLFARALKNHKVEDLIAGAGSAAVAAPAAAAAAAPAAGGSAAPAEKGGKPAKQEEPEEEEDADMGFSLFD